MADLVSVQVKGNVGTIEDNLDAVELCIREKVQEYSMMVITEDSVKNGKKFLADIRKEKKALDDDRKAIKERWMAPYEAFEKRAKQIISLYDEPVNVINGQLAEYEEKRRQAKRQGIQKAYDFVNAFTTANGKMRRIPRKKSVKIWKGCLTRPKFLSPQ